MSFYQQPLLLQWVYTRMVDFIRTYLKNNWQSIVRGVFLLIVLGGFAILGLRYLRVELYKSLAMSSGPNVPLIYGQDLAPGMIFKEGEGLLQLVQLIKDVKTNYNKTGWDLNQLQPPSSTDWIEPIPPERATLVYRQWIQSPNKQTGGPVEGGSVTMFIGKDGTKDDVLSDGFIPGITPRDPAITKDQALQKLVLPLGAKASSPELVYHITKQDFENSYNDDGSVPIGGGVGFGSIDTLRAAIIDSLGQGAPSPAPVETAPSQETLPQETPEVETSTETDADFNREGANQAQNEPSTPGINPCGGIKCPPQFPDGGWETQKIKIGQKYRLAYRTVISEAVAPFIADNLGGYGSRWRGTNFTSSGSSCTQNSQCTVLGDICFAGQCQPPGLQGGSCDVKQGNKGCAAGLVCNSSTKTCEATNVMQECTVNADCNLDPKNPTKICGTDNLCHIDETKLPPGAASGEGNGLLARYTCYYNDTNQFGNEMYSELDADDPVINYTWGTSGPAKLNCKTENFDQTRYNHFGGAWGGVLIPPTTGTYTFYLDADDYGKIVVGTTVVDSSGKPKGEYSGTVNLVAGQHYGFGVSMRETTQNAKIIVSWQKPGSTKELLPRKYLYTYDALPPQITTQPASVTVMQTQQVQLSITTGGTKPLTIQWQKNGVDIPGATGLTYTIPAAVIGDSGTYRATVRNDFGSDTSQTAQVTVNPIPGGSGDGLHGYYYVDTNLSSDKLNTDRVDSQVNFHWGFLSPFSGVECHAPTPCWKGEGFGVRWYGDIYAPVAGDYFFGFKTVGGGENQWAGARVWVDGQLKIDNWYIPSTKLLWTQAIVITTPGKHRIRVDYWSDKKKRTSEADNVNNDSSAELWWRGPNIAQGVIPTEALFPVDFEYLNQKPNVEIGDTVWIDARTGTILDRANSSFDAIGADHFKKYYPWLEEAKQKAKEATQNVSKQVALNTASIFASVAKAAASPPGPKAPPGGSNFGQPPSYGNASFFNYCEDGYDAQGRFAYFASIFYDWGGFDEAMSGLYKRELNDHYGTPAAPGLSPDNDWSAVFDTNFVISNNDTTHGETFVTKLYPTYAGTFRAIVYDDSWKPIYDSGTSYRQPTPKEFGPLSFSTNEERSYHMTIEYETALVDDPALILNAVSCNESGTNCGPKTLFWFDSTAPIREERLYYSQTPSDVHAQAGKTAVFNINYQTTPLGVDIQWVRNHLGQGFVDIAGAKNLVLNWPAGQNDNGDQFAAKMSNGVCQLIDDLPSGTLYIDPAPPTGGLRCTTSNGSDTITITDGETAVFEASDYTSAPKFETCQQASPNQQNNGSETFTSTFNLPEVGGSGFCEPAPVKNPVKVTSFNETTYCYAIIEPKICLTDCDPGGTTTPPISQNTIMWAYEHSPIDPIDKSLSTNCENSSTFPNGECDPHELANPPMIVKTSEGLILRHKVNEPNLITVTSQDPSLNVKDSSTDNNTSKFDYQSIFKNNQKDNRSVIRVAQINAYAATVDSLSQFINHMWYGGADLQGSLRPAGSEFDDFFVNTTILDSESSDCKVKFATNTIYINPFCALDHEAFAHEFFHTIEYALLKDQHIARAEQDDLAVIDEGLSDYFALRNSDSLFVGDYALPLVPNYNILDGTLLPPEKPRAIMSLKTNELNLPKARSKSGTEAMYDVYDYGAVLANSLLQMRSYILINSPQPAYDADIFDKSIIHAYRQGQYLNTLPSSFKYNNLTLDRLQMFYSSLVRTLRSQGFASTSYFSKKILYDQLKMGAISRYAGVKITRDPEKQCVDDGSGLKKQLYDVFFEYVGAIDAKVNKVTLSLSNFDTGAFVSSYTFTVYAVDQNFRLPDLPKNTPFSFRGRIPIESQDGISLGGEVVVSTDEGIAGETMYGGLFMYEADGCK